MPLLIRRIGFYLIAAYAAITLDFFIPRMLPGNALSAILTQMRGVVTPAQLASMAAEYGADDKQSLLSQYFTYVGHTLSGNFGLSLSHQETPVSTVLGGDLPWTIGLIGSATVVAFLLGTLIGIMAGWRRGGLLDAIVPVSTFFQAIPYFVLGLLLLIIFGSDLAWFPIGGGYDTTNRYVTYVQGWNWPYMSSVLQHLVLPGTTVVLASIAGWIVGMRNMMITTMDEDYVLVAAAKGLSRFRVIGIAARNAILPTISNFTLSISLVVTGAVLVEVVFDYPGIGNEMFNAITAADYPLLQGILLVVTFAVLIANFLADLAYVVLDPRSRREA
ncbi:ABC transporter permease [Actinospica durhamensis]|uniref:ABC transporter permease n=1 Tax=Actinospica durhamensis TaxID=1508375 RepID=A0A941IL76_9ACTN|nr:ABC transporter permease [Actinospica durhamensis]MBR7832695.1 ABC transporter permease [Actinospica durhamensis]